MDEKVTHNCALCTIAPLPDPDVARTVMTEVRELAVEGREAHELTTAIVQSKIPAWIAKGKRFGDRE